MSEPRDYPCVRYWPDGRFVLVETPADYAALEPGHADNPSGPFTAPPEEDPDPETLAGVNPEFTAALHQQARAMRAEGRSQQAIAEHFGISRRTVRQWLEE